MSVGSRFFVASSILWSLTRRIVSCNAFSCSFTVVSSLIFVWNRPATCRCSSSSVKWFMIWAGLTSWFSYCSYKSSATCRKSPSEKSSGVIYFSICRKISSLSISHVSSIFWDTRIPSSFLFFLLFCISLGLSTGFASPACTAIFPTSFLRSSNPTW